MKRMLTLLAAGVVTSALLFGCGPKAPDVPTAPTSKGEGPAGSLNSQGQAPATKLAPTGGG